MEHMLAAESDRWLFAEARSIANLAVIINRAAIENSVLRRSSLIIDLDTAFLETG
jgi:hypothetical protein